MLQFRCDNLHALVHLIVVGVAFLLQGSQKELKMDSRTSGLLFFLPDVLASFAGLPARRWQPTEARLRMGLASSPSLCACLGCWDTYRLSAVHNTCGTYSPDDQPRFKRSPAERCIELINRSDSSWQKPGHIQTQFRLPHTS
jgi:hypothetical protein